MITGPEKLELEEVTLPDWPFAPLGIAYGQGNRLQLEVVYSSHSAKPNPGKLRSAWKKRQEGRGVPLLVIVLHGEKASVCGASGDDPTVYPDLDPGQVERICLEALEQPSRQAALRALRDSLGALEEDGLPGLRNEGFLASHELASGVPKRTDWVAAGKKSKSLLGEVGKGLLQSLGYTIEGLDKVASVLRVAGRKKAVAILLNDQETPESGSQRIPGTLSPVSYALARADEENLDWVVLVHGRKIRLYPVKMGVGVGRRGRTETFLECHTGIIPDDRAAYLWLLFSADALAENGSLDVILNASKDFAGALAIQLRERIYDEVIPRLAAGLSEARGIKKPSVNELTETYQMAMRVLFRLLFISYGEDKDLLPYRFNGLYQKRSLKAKARELVEIPSDSFDDGDSWWREIQTLFRAVDQGNRDWGVPAYGGGLFSSDPNESAIGANLASISLPNNVVGPVLQSLLLVPTDDGLLGPVDFRSLGVREFGTIYEGLLESELSVAETNLTVESRGKEKDSYRPAKAKEEVIVKKGDVYLHNNSGARKSTGSFYTKSFAVEHLLDDSLEPAIDNHFKRLDALDDVDASDAFFDFRVADIAMGSAHFLVAAVDRIEARFSSYLSKRPLPHIATEISGLRTAAITALGDAADSYDELEDNALLRRLIARRCIYGADINEVAVQLARLGIWIHTFVPGLPLSLLDRNLIHGNSLIGVGKLSEFEDYIRESGASLFALNARDFVGDASEALERMGKLADATRSEILQARKAWSEADRAIEPARALCDLVTAARIENEELPFDFTRWHDDKNSVANSREHRHAKSVVHQLNPIHFPIAFPEVFLRKRSGFDVILGNPPWEEATLEEDAFWARYFPGLRGLPQKEQERLKEEYRKSRPDLVSLYQQELSDADTTRNALVTGPFPGMGTGDPDVYKAFCWRFWALSARDGGRIGVVLPRSALAAKGSTEFRSTIFEKAKLLSATLLLNTARWVFDMEPRYTVGLVAIERSTDESVGCSVYLEGPFNSLEAYLDRVIGGGSTFPGTEILGWNDTASLPLLPTPDSVGVFRQLRQAPRLDLNEKNQWRARPHTELHATNDKKDGKTVLIDLKSDTCPAGFRPVYKGESFDIWQPDTGIYYGWGNTKALLPYLQKKRKRGKNLRRSVFYECEREWCDDPKTLPCLHHRIVFRDITRATDSRTVRCALLPPDVFVTNKGPYLVFPRGDVFDEAFLLGLLSSLPLDWYARRYVELGLNFHVFGSLPIPRPSSKNLLRKRVIQLAGRLACPDDRFASWAKQVGVQCGPIKEDEKQNMIHELDAVVAHLYGLTRDHLIHIFETFHVGWNYQSRLDATLQHYDNYLVQP